MTARPTFGLRTSGLQAANSDFQVQVEGARFAAVFAASSRGPGRKIRDSNSDCTVTVTAAESEPDPLQDLKFKFCGAGRGAAPDSGPAIRRDSSHDLWFSSSHECDGPGLRVSS